jgi:hypothetical protein
MKIIIHVSMLILVLVVSGCDDMKMDRKVEKQTAIFS